MNFRKRRKNNRAFANKKLLSLADLGIMVMMMFVFTITVFNEKGLMAKMPPWSDMEPETICYKMRDVLFIRIDDQNQLLVNKKFTSISKLRNQIKTFILNHGKKENYSTSPKSAIVSFKPNVNTQYETYFNVYHEIKAVYNEIWDEEAQKRFGYKFKHLDNHRKQLILDDYPYVLSEGEPTNYTYAER